MPHRPPRNVKKPKTALSADSKAAHLEDQRRREMATRSTLARFQNRTSDRK